KITLIKKAIGDTPGEVQMLDNNNSSVVDGAASEEKIDIEVSTLDTELRNMHAIDFIKNDVEGYEMHVLKGAAEIIKKHRPVFLVEVHPGYLQNYGMDHSSVIAFFID